MLANEAETMGVNLSERLVIIYSAPFNQINLKDIQQKRHRNRQRRMNLEVLRNYLNFLNMA
jgi:hypothetical protein